MLQSCSNAPSSAAGGTSLLSNTAKDNSHRLLQMLHPLLLLLDALQLSA
jgi:hypothetical protein